jgi:hypothetical protein
MNVYNRPLFRQAGGPAQMMPQDMAQQGMPPQGMAPQGMPPQGGSGVDPQMEQALTAAEQQSAAGMAEVGASYAESMMSGLDNAEDYKTVIDSIRGNALPMEARYSELASLVGEEDARKTPESVLTLIQPTIMMTEQGAMDSGIGELMRQVTGEIDMEAENGMPTEMGQGVGSLMTAGVGQQPTQNFSLGGPVVRMGTGGNPRLEQLSSEILGNYRNIMGDGEDQKKLTQAQILFDIADAAGRFASGTNAQGQSVAGLSPFAQLGAATSGLGGRIGERVGELDKQDRALKLSALGAAQTEYNAEQAAARAATSDKSLGKFYDIIVDNKVVATEALSTKSDVALIKEMYPNATIRESKEPTVTDANIFAIRDSEGNQKNYNLNDPKQLKAFLEESQAPGVTSGKVPTLSGEAPKEAYETLRVAGQDKRYLVGSPEYKKALELGGVVVGAVSGDAPEDKSSFGNSLEGLQLAMLTDETRINKFQSGKLTAAEETEFVGALENYIAPKRDQFGTSISNPLPARIIQALRARQDAGLPVSENIDPALYMPKSEAAALEAIRLIPLDIDITMATGPLGAIQAGLESTLSGASEILPFLPSTSGSVIGGAEALEAKKAVSALAQATERFYTDGRILATEFANIQKELVRPDQVTNDAEALAAFEKQKSLLLQAQQRGNNILANPKSFSVEELRGARQDLAAITQLLPDYNEAIRQYSNKINGTTTGKQNPANFDRRKGQGSGPTVIDGYTIEAIQ